MDALSQLPTGWQNVIIAAAGELTGRLVWNTLAGLGRGFREAPQDRALQAAFTRAGAAFLSCLDLPQEYERQRILMDHVVSLLEPVFADSLVQDALSSAVLHEGRPESISPEPFLDAWARIYGTNGEKTLPWRENLDMGDAFRAFAEVLENEVERRPELHSFLLAARLKSLFKHIETGVQVEGMEQLLQTLGRMETQQATLISLFAELARMGLSVKPSIDPEGVDGLTATTIITEDGVQVQVPDRGEIARYYKQLPDESRVLSEYGAHIHRITALYPLEGLVLPQIGGRPWDPALLRIPLNRVYIRLRGIPRERDTLGKQTPEKLEDVPKLILRRQLARRKWESFPSQASRTAWLEDAVAGHEAVVILGEPGAGKSTFMRHLAWISAGDMKSLPLLLNLREVDLGLNEGRSFLDVCLELLTAHEVGSKKYSLRIRIEESLSRKRVHWLLDGFDEVRHHRREIADSISHLIAQDQRVVVTSRPTGYIPIPGTQLHYEIQPLLPDQIDHFVERWFAALAEASNIEEAVRHDWVVERIRWMGKQLEDRPSLRELAKNPLMVTFMIMLAGDEPRAEFPLHRKDLYIRYIDRLFAGWEMLRESGETDLLPGVPDCHEALEEVSWGFRQTALCLQRAYSGSPHKATYEAVSDSLADMLDREMRVSRFQAIGRARSILKFWEQVGILDRFLIGGQEWLAFRHLSLQEFGAASTLVGLHSDNSLALWSELEARLFDEQWSEVIPFVLSCLDDATWLAERLLERTGSDVELQRPLFMVALALSDGAYVEDSTRRRVVDELEHLVKTREFLQLHSGLDPSDAFAALARMHGDTYAQHKAHKLWEEWLALARGNEPDADRSLDAAVALVDLGFEKEALPIFDSLVLNAKAHWKVRWEALNNLPSNRVEALLDEFDMDDPLAIWAYDDSGLDIDEVIEQRDFAEAVSDVLLDAGYERSDALEQWGYSATGVDLVWRLFYEDGLASLDDVARGLYFPEDCLKVARSLGLNGFEQEAAGVLLALFKSSRLNAADIEAIVRLLGEIAPDQLHEILPLLFGPDSEPSVRKLIGGTVRNLGHTSSALAQAFQQVVENKALDVEARLDAIENLMYLGYEDAAGSALLEIIGDDQIAILARVRAADAIPRHAHATWSSALVAGLQNLAEDMTQPEAVRQALVRAIRTRGSSTDVQS